MVLQFLGALAGILISFLCSHITYPNADQKVIVPTVPTLCPELGGDDCMTQGLTWQLFLMETIASFLLVTTFLVVRYAQMGTGQKWMKFVGPFILLQVYTAILSLQTSTLKGPSNPTVALQLLFWSEGAYNYVVNTVTGVT